MTETGAEVKTEKALNCSRHLEIFLIRNGRKLLRSTLNAMLLTEKKRRAKKGSNLRFIADYMFANPGCTSTEVRRALCSHRGKAYHRGMYSDYFSKTWTKPKDYIYPDRYWTKLESGGWILTLQGLRLVGHGNPPNA